MKKSSLLLFGCMALGSASALAQTNLIADPGFSTPDVTTTYGSTYVYSNGFNGSTVINPPGGPSSAGSPWIFTEQAGLISTISGNAFGVPADPSFGAQVGFIQYNSNPPGNGHPTGAGSLAQNFTVTNLDVYTLTFSYLNRSTNDLLNFNVMFDGNVIATLQGTTTVQPFSFNLGSLGANTNHSLSFSAIAPMLGEGQTFDGTVFIDNVAVVPEPGTWLAGGLAMVGCGVFVARRQRKPAVIAAA